MIASLNGVEIRQYGLPLNETLIVSQTGGVWIDALNVNMVNTITYFSGNNDERLNIIKPSLPLLVPELISSM